MLTFVLIGVLAVREKNLHSLGRVTHHNEIYFIIVIICHVLFQLRCGFLCVFHFFFVLRVFFDNELIYRSNWVPERMRKYPFQSRMIRSEASTVPVHGQLLVGSESVDRVFMINRSFFIDGILCPVVDAFYCCIVLLCFLLRSHLVKFLFRVLFIVALNQAKLFAQKFFIIVYCILLWS